MNNMLLDIPLEITLSGEISSTSIADFDSLKYYAFDLFSMKRFA